MAKGREGLLCEAIIFTLKEKLLKLITTEMSKISFHCLCKNKGASNETSRWHIQNKINYLNHGAHRPRTFWILKLHLFKSSWTKSWKKKNPQTSKSFKIQNFWFTKSLNHKATGDWDSILGK